MKLSKLTARSIFVLLGILIVTLGSPCLTSGQNVKSDKINYWFDFGLGLGTAGSGPATSPSVGLSARLAAHIQLNRVIVTGNTNLSGGGRSDFQGAFGKARDYYFDRGILLGYELMEMDSWKLVISAGVAETWGDQIHEKIDDDCSWFCIDYERKRTRVITGVPVELGFYTRGQLTYGYSLTAHMNFNSETKFFMITWNIMLGKRD